MPGSIGPLEIGIVLIVALVVFGPKRLPELGHGLGRGLREFKDSVTGNGDGETPPEQLVSAPSGQVDRAAGEAKASSEL